jgi:DNA replication protein DnaC
MKVSTVITSNRPVQDWLGLSPDQVMAQAVVDRLRQNAHFVVIEGDSYRGRYQPGTENKYPLRGSRQFLVNAHG